MQNLGIAMALLHESETGRSAPFSGHTYPAAIRSLLATGVYLVSTFRVDPVGTAIDDVTFLRHR